MTLFQCYALNNETKISFIKSFIPIFIFPLFNFSLATKYFENLQLNSLEVIGALLKSYCPEVINFLINTYIVKFSENIIKKANELYLKDWRF